MKKLLLFLLIYISIPALSMQLNSAGNTPWTAFDAALHYIVERESGATAIEGITQLIEAGANLNNPNHEGRTAIWIAALEGKDDIYDFLLSHGANPNMRSKGGQWAGFSAKELHEISREEIEKLRSEEKSKLP